MHAACVKQKPGNFPGFDGEAKASPSSEPPVPNRGVEIDRKQGGQEPFSPVFSRV